MATPERLILNSVTDTTGLGQRLGRRDEIHVIPGRYASEQFRLAIRETVLTVVRTFTRPSDKTLLQTIIDDLERIGRRADYLFKPSKHAMHSARLYLFETYLKMGAAFPRPAFVLDGEKGLIIKWVKNGYSVRVNCLPNETDGDYIYYENGEYDIEENVTPESIHNRLNWLNQHG